MTRLFLTFLSVLFFALPLFAQSVDTAWVRRYNGTADSIDEANAMVVDGSGNVYVTGWSYGIGTYSDYATIKYYPNGDTAWVRRYNGPRSYWDGADAIAVDSSGNVYVTGGSWSNITSNDYATIKYYPNGDTAWVRIYDGPGHYEDAAYAIAVDGSGNVYVTGRSWGSGTYFDYTTIKYYPNGDTAWVRRYNGPGNGLDWGDAIAVDGSGNIYVTGQSYGSGTDYDYSTIKYKPDGDTAWIRRYNGPGNSGDEARAIAVDSSGNVCVTGNSYGSGTYNDYATLKYYPNGDTAWVRRYNGPANDYDRANALVVDGSGNVYVTGRSWGSGTSDNYATLKYYPNGDTAWVRMYDGPGNFSDEALAIAIDDSSKVYVTGYSSQFSSFPFNLDYATLRYNSDGTQSWVKRYNGTADNDDQSQAIAVDGSGNVYVTGYSFGSGTDRDYATIKYVQFLRGDANGDKKVTIADIVYLVSYLFKHGPAPNPIQSGDANCDGKVTIADIVYLVAYLFKGGPLPCI